MFFRMKLKFCKTTSILAMTVFAAAQFARPAAGYALRPQAALNRAGDLLKGRVVLSSGGKIMRDGTMEVKGSAFMDPMLPADTRAALRDMFRYIGKEITLRPYSDGLGSNYTGIAQIVTLILQERGRALPMDREYFMPPKELEPLIQETIVEGPHLAREEVYLPVSDNRGGYTVEKVTRYYNKLYRRILNERRPDLSEDEINYLLLNLSENSVARYLIMYLKGVPLRAASDAQTAWKKTRAADADDPRRPAWETEGVSADQERVEFTELWERVTARAKALRQAGALGGVARAAWQDVVETRVDPVTGLESGNPKRKPFAAQIDLEKLHRETVDREAKKTVSTVSGIRGQFGDAALFGNLPLPPTFSGRQFDVGTVPTDAALVNAATQVELLIKML